MFPQKKNDRYKMNDISSADQKCKFPRLQGKTAVPHASIMGMRVNMCARMVISPGCSIKYARISKPNLVMRKNNIII